MSGSFESEPPEFAAAGDPSTRLDSSADWMERGLRAALRPATPPADGDSVRSLAGQILERADALWQEFDESKGPPEIGERYTLLDEIGHGGMGVVYRALDRTLGREVAIKTIRRRVRDVAELRARFVEEAKICSALEHPGIVPIHDLVFSQDGTPFFVMKLIRGRTLATLLAEPIRDEQHRRTWLQVFERACQAIAYAHVRGVLHRDIKPSNIMVGEFGEVHVLDWGLLKIAAGTTLAPVDEKSGEYPADATRYGEVLGTAAYMSPEQALGEVHRITARTDVFNLGALLLEILTGSPPYPGSDSRTEVRRARVGCGERAAAALRAAGVDHALTGIVTACLANDPGVRPADASDLTQRLSAYLASESERTRRSEIAAAQARTAAQHERRVRFITMGAAGLILALGFAAVRTMLRTEGVERAHALSNERTIASSLHQAELLRTEWLSSAALELDKLRYALAASEEAVTRASAPDTAPEVRRRAITLRDALAETLSAAQRDAALSARLAQLRNQADNNPNPLALRQHYVEALGNAGLDLEALPIDRLVEQVKAMRVAPEILDALDDFMLSFRPELGIPPQLGRVAAIASAIDADETRRSIRFAFAKADVASLLQLRNPSLAELPSQTLLLIARALRQLAENEASIETFRQAVKRFPGSARLRHDYALALIETGETSYDEAERQLDTCVAIEPSNKHFRDDRALMSVLRDRFLEASELLAESLALDPDNAATWSAIGELRLKQGEAAGALEAIRRAVEIEPDSIGLRLSLLNALSAAARYSECLEVLESIALGSPEEAFLPELHAAANVDVGDFEKGREFADKARMHRPLRPVRSTAMDNAQVLALAERAAEIEAAGGPTEVSLSHCANADDALAIGLLASRRGRLRLATNAYQLVAERFPESFRRVGLSCRLQAVWIALSSGVGLGADSAALTEATLARDRELALTWLNEELASTSESYDCGRASAIDVRMLCSYFRNNPRLRRAYDALDELVLPARERLLWNAARADIEVLYAQVGPLHDVDTAEYLALPSRATDY